MSCLSSSNHRWTMLVGALLAGAGCEDASTSVAPRDAGLDASLMDAMVQGSEMDAAVDRTDDADTPALPEQEDAGSLPPLFASMKVELESAARSKLVELTFAAATPTVTLRVSVPGKVDPNLCFSLEDVRANDTQAWVDPATIDDYAEFCTNCSERVSLGAGYGLFTLPSGHRETLSLEKLSLRVSLRECDTLTPWSESAPRPPSITLEWATHRPKALPEDLTLPVAVVLASEIAFASSTRDALLQEALAFAQSTWQAGHVTLDIQEVVQVTAAPDPVLFAPDERSALNELAARAKAALRSPPNERLALVVLTPCLTLKDPLAKTSRTLEGYSSHLPGGFGVGDEADGVFITVDQCSAITPRPRYTNGAELGAVIAHEIGHFLGLYHVREAGGRVEDRLPDTDPATANLMQVIPVSSANALTEQQVEVARRHLALVPKEQ